MTHGLRIFLYIFPAIILLGGFVPLYFKLKWQGEKASSVVVKGFATLVPVIFCLNGCIVNNFRGFWWLLAGLLLCLGGDIARERSLFAGMAGFFATHLLFIRAFTVFASPELSALPVFLVLYLATAAVFCRKLIRFGSKSIPVLLYAAALFAMLALALTLPFTLGTGILALGALLFTVSDILLAYRILHNINSRRSDVVCLSVYYAGLYLIALTVWV